jgi:hypothetical protein
MRTLSCIFVLCGVWLCGIHAYSHNRQALQQGGQAPPTQMKFEYVQEPCQADCGDGVCEFRYRMKPFLKISALSFFERRNYLHSLILHSNMKNITGPMDCGRGPNQACIATVFIMIDADRHYDLSPIIMISRILFHLNFSMCAEL